MDFCKTCSEMFCYRTWHSIKQRCAGKYAKNGIEVRMTKKEFYAWWDSNFYLMKKMYNSGAKPSVDRIDPNGHYEVSNLRVLERWDNVKMSRRRSKRPVKGVNIKTKEIKFFDGISDAAEHTGAFKSGIVMVCRGRKDRKSVV